MKKLLYILLLFSPILALAQSKGEFILTPNGFVNKDDVSLNYVLIDYPGESQTDLYKKTLKYLNTQFTSPKDALSLVENESITINTIDNRVPVQGYAGLFTVNYTLTIEFKDNKLRILAPSINQIYGYPVRDVITIGVTGDRFNKTIYNSKGDLKLEKTKQVLELIFKSWIIRTKLAMEKAKSDTW